MIIDLFIYKPIYPRCQSWMFSSVLMLPYLRFYFKLYFNIFVMELDRVRVYFLPRQNICTSHAAFK